MTQGKGSYRMEMDHYDIVPQLVAEKILANAKRPPEKKRKSRVHFPAQTTRPAIFGGPSPSKPVSTRT